MLEKGKEKSIGIKVSFFIIILFVVFMPVWAPKMWLHLLIEIFVVTLLATSLNMVLGRSGLLSIGHACFYAVGGYTFAILAAKFKVPFVLAMLGVPAMVVIFAAIIGYFSIRLTGIHFAILTMGFAQIIWAIAHKWYKFTGGDDGMTRIPIPAILQDLVGSYYFILGVLTLSLIIMRLIQDSSFGQIIIAIRENRERVTFSGINVWHYLLLNFIIAALFAGIGGFLWVLFTRSVFPAMGYWTTSASLILMCILGGVGVFWGPMLGAVILTLAEHYLSMYIFYWQLVLGCLIIVLVVFMPGGICGFIREKVEHKIY